MGFLGDPDSKESTCNVEDLGSLPGLGRSPGEGNGNPLQYSCLENSMDRGAWWAIVHGVVKSRTRLSNFTFTFHFHALEKEMATHSSSCLENPRDGGAWWAAIYGVAQSWTQLKRLSSSSRNEGNKVSGITLQATTEFMCMLRSPADR